MTLLFDDSNQHKPICIYLVIRFLSIVCIPTQFLDFASFKKQNSILKRQTQFAKLFAEKPKRILQKISSLWIYPTRDALNKSRWQK